MLMNAGSLIGTTAVTSILGFVYWWVAARRFSPEVVGIASASVSAMMLLGNFSVVGLGTLLITELPRKPEKAKSLTSTALIVVGIVGIIVGALFALVAPYVSIQFEPLRGGISQVLIFALGVSFTSITFVLDQALIGKLKGNIQLRRNIIFATVKLLALLAVSLLIPKGTGIIVYATWAFGSLLSLIVIAVPVLLKKQESIRNYLPRWSLLRKLGVAAIQHHVLNITLQLPALILPVLITILLSAKTNGWFYISWMIASFVFFISSALTTVLHAMNSAQPSSLANKARMTIGLSLLTGVLVNVVLQIATKQVLGLFGSSYANQATWCLRVLLLAVFPLTIKNHYISICRIHDHITHAILVLVPSSIFELGGAVVGAHFGQLMGLSIGWIVVVYIEGFLMLSTVYKTVWGKEVFLEPVENNYSRAKAIWLIETASQPIIGSIGVEALWLADTFKLPILRLPSVIQSGEESGRGRKSLIEYKEYSQSLKPLISEYSSSYMNIDAQKIDKYLPNQLLKEKISGR